MTRTGRTLEEYMDMGAAGKVALISFIENLERNSALRRAMDPDNEITEWHTTFKTNAILADLFDLIVAIRTPRGQTPKTYPRPTEEKQEIGKDAIPVSEFWDWWNKEE